ncbi:MAG: hypothetical protein M1837_006076 [Sclerophora amabilis]|nr:MAG: hypothetical protein M1837_006076 [Sclerophora amabilis]
MQPPIGFVPSTTLPITLDASSSDSSSSLVTAATVLLSASPSSLADAALSSTATLLSAIATTPSGTAEPDHGPNDNDDGGECNLLGPFSLFIQGALGLLALLSLVWKRYRERPQRPLKIWTFDASKQVVGSVLVHIANLLMSMLSAGQFAVTVDGSGSSPSKGGSKDEVGGYRPNPCSFYLLNLAIDTTIGIPILVVLLRLLTYGFTLTPMGNPPESIKSGNYGHPPKTKWWFKQSIIYFLGLLGMKLCVLFIFTLLPWISHVGDWALRWTEGDKALQVVFVMLLFPLIMNALQYYIIDSFIKDSNVEGHEPVPDRDEDDFEDEQSPHIGRRSSGSEDDGSEVRVIGAHVSDDEDLLAKDMEAQTEESSYEADKQRRNAGNGASDLDIATKKYDEYDPTGDGDGKDSPTLVGSNSHSDR